MAPDDGIIRHATDDNAIIHVSRGDSPVLIPHVSLQLIFWGSGWPNPAVGPSSDQITAAVQKMLRGPFMSGLLQYGIGYGTLRGTTTLPGDPLNPFTKHDWHSLIWGLIDNGVFPFPDEDGGRNLYLFITLPGVGVSTGDYAPGTGGAHGYPWQYDFPADVDYVWAGFVLNDGTLKTITERLSHELVEACTDAEDDGWTIDGRSSPNAEIGDDCVNTKNSVDGVAVQGYWSNFDNACIIPTVFSLKRFLLMSGRDPTKGLRVLQPAVTSVRNLITS